MKQINNRITFIGTGGGRIVRASQQRGFGGFVVNLQGHQIHFDPGPGALNSLKLSKLSPSQTDIIFVSHAHIDHANDINAIIDSITLGGINKKGTLISVPSVIEGKDDVPWLRNFYKNKLEKIYSVKPGDKIQVNDLIFEIKRTKHDEPDCVGAVLKLKDFSLGYTSDTAYFPALADEFKGVKVLILNVLRPGKDEWDSHLCTEDAIEMIDEIKPELAVLYHFGAKMINANPLYEARRVQRATGVRTVAAEDGMFIELAGMFV